MSRDDAKKLLGGYATGTLTPEERQALFEAALEHQELFDELAREQSLRDLLSDPAARGQLLAALDEAPASGRQRVARWIWGHAVGVAAVACFAAIGVYIATQAGSSPERIRMIANQPTTIDVTESAEAPPKPRRVFDFGSAKRVAPQPALPTPPAVPRRTSAGQLAQLHLPAAMPAPPAPPAESGKPVSEAQPTLALLPPVIPAPPAAPPATPQAAGGGVAGRLPAATEQVSVTAMATPVQTASSDGTRLVDARGLNQFSVTSRSAAALSNLLPGAELSGAAGVVYRILRKLPNGDFEEVQPNVDLNAGDRVKLEFDVAAPGTLYVAEIGAAGAAQPLIRRTLVQASLTSPEFRVEKPGRKQFYVSFMRPGQSAGGPAAGALRPATALTQQKAKEEKRADAAPKAAEPQQPTSFLITLNYK